MSLSIGFSNYRNKAVIQDSSVHLDGYHLMPFSAGREKTIVFNIAVQLQELLHISHEHFGTCLSSSVRAFALGPNLGLDEISDISFLITSV